MEGLGLLHSSGLLERYEDNDEALSKKETTEAVVKLWRKGHAEPFIGRYSIDDAKAAGQWGKDTWKKFPRDMLWRAALQRGARRGFPDKLKGLIDGGPESVEVEYRKQVESGDAPSPEQVNTTVEVEAFTTADGDVIGPGGEVIGPGGEVIEEAPAPEAAPASEVAPVVQGPLPDLDAESSYEGFKNACRERGLTADGAVAWLKDKIFPRPETEDVNDVGALWVLMTGKERGAAMEAIVQ